MSGDRLMDAAEVAEMLSVPVGWVREHTRSGAIPCIELGRYRRYARVDVLAWIDSLRAGGGPAFRKHKPTTPPRAAEGGGT
jgi:excisionase family DNA binding protein